MKPLRSIWMLTTLACGFAAGAAGAQQSPTAIPAPIATMLKEHVGRWRATGELVADGRTLAFSGTRECEAFQHGAGVLCRWHDTHSPDGQAHEYIEILGFDADTGLLRSARVGENGLLSTVTLEVHGTTMVARWESGTGAQTTVGRNEITVTPGNGWLQHFTLETGGRRTMEMNIRHERIRP